MNQGGRGAAVGYEEVAEYGEGEGDGEGMEDIEVAPEEPEEPQPKPKTRKRLPSNMSTMGSGFSVVKKEKKNIELLDYDEMAQINGQALYAGTANIQGEDMDPNALLEPHQ